MERETQEEQVIKAIRKEGGCVTLRRLYEIVDTSGWKTQTPDATIRRVVQKSRSTFKVEAGLWALRDCREEVLRRYALKDGGKHVQEQFSHGYYQGLIVEVGKCKNLKTYVPAQDKGRLFLDRRLGDVADMVDIPKFTYEHLLRKARTVDVIWFNERWMPAEFYEVEHTTDMRNSLGKFYELQDFNAKFFIVADGKRKREFEDKMNDSIYRAIASRVKFLAYDKLASKYSLVKDLSALEW